MIKFIISILISTGIILIISSLDGRQEVKHMYIEALTGLSVIASAIILGVKCL